MAQAMLKNYDLDTRMPDRNYVGTGYKGYAMQFHWQSAPDYIWTLAEKYLGLPAGALNNVYAVAVSFESNAMGRVIDLGVKMVDAQEVRGIMAQPLNIWGHESFRKSYIIGDSTLNTTYLTTTLGFSAEDRKYPVAPKSIDNGNEDMIAVPIYAEDGSVVGFKQIAKAAKPNGDNFQSGLKKVADIKAIPAANNATVALTTATSGAEIYYTTDGSIPSSSSTKYTAAVAITGTQTLKAVAVKSGMLPSYFEETYTNTTK